MKIRHTAFMLILALFTLQASAANFDRVVIFGDSLSDNGNIYRWSSRANTLNSDILVVPKSPPYYEGRFSDGPVWVEEFVTKLGFTDDAVKNYAYGGACITSECDSPVNLSREILLYLTSATFHFNFHHDDILFIIWIGSNDYLGNTAPPQTTTDNTVNALGAQIERLIKNGGQYFLVPNLMDFTYSPAVKNAGEEAVKLMGQYFQYHNEKLQIMLEDLQQRYPQIHIYALDAAAAFDDVVQISEKYGITNTGSACYTGGYTLTGRHHQLPNRQTANAGPFQGNAVLSLAHQLANGARSTCDVSSDYLFWDGIHPTANSHLMIANMMYDQFITRL